jgi:hypothetical protein
MRRILPVVLAACFSERPCDERRTARELAGEGALDCGSFDPYVDRWDPTARELSEPCMVDAFRRGERFFAAALVECEDDTCRFEGRAFDGTDYFVLQQWLLQDWAFTSEIQVTRCTPALRRLLVATPTGDAVSQRIVCEERLGFTEIDHDACLQTPHELELWHVRRAPTSSGPPRTPVAAPPRAADPSR